MIDRETKKQTKNTNKKHRQRIRAGQQVLSQAVGEFPTAFVHFFGFICIYLDLFGCIWICLDVYWISSSWQA
jgi:hypothetical protein